MSDGFLVVDKPRGITSNDVVGRVRRATGSRKVGHAGTLDPLATGALVLAIGSVTRLIRYVQDQPKEYRAKAQFGVATDSLDADGTVTDTSPMSFTRQELEDLVPDFVGEIQQVPPMVSALKQDGKRLYELAREGQTVEREPREVTIHELEILSVGDGDYPEVEFRVVCGKGTYVRSLADDMAGRLGGSAHLTALRRTRIGSLKASMGVVIDDLDNWAQYLLTPVEALDDMPDVVVDEADVSGVRNGVRFDTGVLADSEHAGPFKVLSPSGEMLAVYKRDEALAIPEVVLPS